MRVPGDIASLEDGSPAPSEQALLLCIERLHALIGAETRALRAPGRVDFQSLNHRKSHALLELIQLGRNAPGRHGVASRQAILRLRDALAENAAAIELRLRATQEIATLVIEKMLEEESDGTYGDRQGPRDVR